jgi:hypothetical protein
MAKRPGKREEAIDKGKLALACLKERWAYRDFLEKKFLALAVALTRYRDGHGRKEHNQTKSDLEAESEDFRVFGDLHRECLELFGIANLPLSERKLSVDDVLLLLDPDIKVKDIPKRIEFVLVDMFSPKRIYPVSNEGVPDSVLVHEGAGIAYITSKPIEPYQRLLLIDMRGSYVSLKEEFAEYLERVKRTRELPCPQDELREDWHTYDSWMPDNSRKRKEAWECLEVWHMVANLGMKPKEIADELRPRFPKITLDDIEYRFKRGHQLTQGFDCPPGGIKNIRVPKAAALRQTCRTCDKRETCEGPCADVDRYGNYGRKAQRGMGSGKEPGVRPKDDPRVRASKHGTRPSDHNDDDADMSNTGNREPVKMPCDEARAKFDPCGNPIKRKEAPLPLTLKQIKERKEWAAKTSRTDY